MAEQSNFYPQLTVKHNTKPNRWYAFPFLGFIFKLIILIPVGLWYFLLVFAYLFFWIGTPFVILFTGKYWDAAYKFFLGYMKFTAKISLFITGITDKYPGFSLDTNEAFTLTLHKPTAPNRWLALPLFGLLVRAILMIPYSIFDSVMSNGLQIATFFSWFFVLFKGKYPESLYEFNRDAIRVSLASQAYGLYLSDKYPSFSISMKHQTVKVLLLIGGAILMMANWGSSWNDSQEKSKNQSQYEQQQELPSSMDYETL